MSFAGHPTFAAADFHRCEFEAVVVDTMPFGHDCFVVACCCPNHRSSSPARDQDGQFVAGFRQSMPLRRWKQCLKFLIFFLIL